MKNINQVKPSVSIRLDEEDTSKNKPTLLLIETLKPLWKLTQFTGLLLNWSGHQPETYYIFKKILRICILSLSLSSLFGLAIYESYEIIAKLIGNNSTELIASLAINLVFFLPSVHTYLNLLQFLLLNEKLAELIRNFHLFESTQLSISDHIKSNDLKRRSRVAYIVIIPSNLFMFVSSALMSFTNPDLPIFLTSKSSLCDIFYIPILQAYQIAVFLLVMLYQILMDLIPSLVYYHAGAAMFAIFNRIESSESHFHKAWSKYNHLRQLVKNMDHIFGWMILIDYGIKFFMICLMSYSILHNIHELKLMEFLMALFIMMGYMMRLLCCVYNKSELFRSREELIAALANYLNTNWLKMNAEERQILSAFEGQVNRDQLAASPKGLFIVKPALLLTMLSLIVTYLIVLLQSN